MRGILSRKELEELEIQIDQQLNGRDPKSKDIEKSLKELMRTYSQDVEYYNMRRSKEAPYPYKYGAPKHLSMAKGIAFLGSSTLLSTISKPETHDLYNFHVTITKDFPVNFL